jgi:hypothetical protein
MTSSNDRPSGIARSDSIKRVRLYALTFNRISRLTSGSLDVALAIIDIVRVARLVEIVWSSIEEDTV